jgi:hypothetical protein
VVTKIVLEGDAPPGLKWVLWDSETFIANL